MKISFGFQFISPSGANVFKSLKNWWLYLFTETSVTQRRYVVNRNTTVKLAAVNKRHRRGKLRVGCFTMPLLGSGKLTPWYLFCLNTYKPFIPNAFSVWTREPAGRFKGMCFSLEATCNWLLLLRKCFCNADICLLREERMALNWSGIYHMRC